MRVLVAVVSLHDHVELLDISPGHPAATWAAKRRWRRPQKPHEGICFALAELEADTIARQPPVQFVKMMLLSPVVGEPALWEVGMLRERILQAFFPRSMSFSQTIEAQLASMAREAWYSACDGGFGLGARPR